MKTPEATFIQAGYAYEKARTAESSRAMADTIRAMIEREDVRDHQEARRLVSIGRDEARLSANQAR